MNRRESEDDQRAFALAAFALGRAALFWRFISSNLDAWAFEEVEEREPIVVPFIRQAIEGVGRRRSCQTRSAS